MSCRNATLLLLSSSSALFSFKLSEAFSCCFVKCSILLVCQSGRAEMCEDVLNINSVLEILQKYVLQWVFPAVHTSSTISKTKRQLSIFTACFFLLYATDLLKRRSVQEPVWCAGQDARSAAAADGRGCPPQR